MKPMNLSQKQINDFWQMLYQYYAVHKRDLPWRQPESGGYFDPYKILVSEIMLQQTQAARVTPKYSAFLEVFPTVGSLAASSLSEVLSLWVGLGYNRRAKYLHDAAKHLQSIGQPWEVKELTACKGVGLNTAKAAVVYSYDRPELFLETNIRTVVIHYFFKNIERVQDASVLEVLAQIVDYEEPREFYWALMDYGAMLKKTVGNTARQSALYRKQTAFAGSKRQLRGAVIRLLTTKPATKQSLQESINDTRLDEVLRDLAGDGLIVSDQTVYKLP